MANRNSTAARKQPAPDYREAIRRVIQLAPAEENDLIEQLRNAGPSPARVASEGPPAQPEDILERPINVLDDSLAQAHAVADLIFTWACTIGDDGDPNEPLCTGTLTTAMHSIMLRIAEAQQASARLATERRP
jgi:hypothetical protein